MTDSKDYMTPDLGKAATVILMTGKWPDEYMRLDGSKPQIVYRWNQLDTLIRTGIAKGELLVEPLSLIRIYRELKMKTFEILDGGTK